MSLSDRLRSAQPNQSNRGCVTCAWWDELKPETQDLFNQWLDNESSTAQLHDICTAPNDDGDEPQLRISLTGFRFHLNHHNERCRRGTQ